VQLRVFFPAESVVEDDRGQAVGVDLCDAVSTQPGERSVLA
jgi:hypothetical protein